MLKEGCDEMKRSGSAATLFALVSITLFQCATAVAQPSASPSQTQNWRMMRGSQTMGGGTNMMSNQGTMRGQGMMSGMPMMAAPLCAGMISGFQDPKSAAKMLRMHAEMMRSNAAIMEKYAKELYSGN
jgi:hypothetical protein